MSASSKTHREISDCDVTDDLVTIDSTWTSTAEWFKHAYIHLLNPRDVSWSDSQSASHYNRFLYPPRGGTAINALVVLGIWCGNNDCYWLSLGRFTLKVGAQYVDSSWMSAT